MKIKDSLLKLLKSSDYKPLKKEEIANVLRIPADSREALYKCIDTLIRENQLETIKKNRIVVTKDKDYIQGTVKFKQNGSGLFFPENTKDTVYIIDKHDTNLALQGDLVLGRIISKPKKPHYFKGKKRKAPSPASNEPSFRILKVLKRARDSYVGTFKKDPKGGCYLLADDPFIVPEFSVEDKPVSLDGDCPETGDKVIFELVNWSQRAVMPEAKITHILGKTHAPKAEFKAILHKYNLDTEFPDPVQKEADALPAQVSEKDIKNRMDLREDYTFTIDPDDAKDFDDALSIKMLPNGIIEVGVHIADVSAYVKPKSPLDIEAQNRGNSTYLVGTVIPMLPHSLSNGLCSLVEGQDRLTKSAIIQFNAEAEIQKAYFANTVIRSNKRLTYKQALAFMEKDDLEVIKKTPLPPKHQTGSIGRALDKLSDQELNHLKSSIQSLWKLAAKLRKNRFKKGSLDLDMNELKIYVDQEGAADRLEKQVNDESHQLIEEFMLIANEQIARLAKRERIAAIYRVHDKPDESRLLELRQIMNSYGVPCNSLNKPTEMSSLLAKLKVHPQAYTLKLQVLKSLKQAQYRSTPDGHYGLSKTDYTHFTSPIRRYSDLIVHRILDTYLCKSKAPSAIEKADIHYTQANLESLAQHICITERNSVDAERESVKVKLLEYFDRELTIKPPNIFDAIITDVKNHGLFIELIDSQAFGMVHISKLGDDNYYLSSNEQNLIGKRSKEVFTIGDRIKVQVSRVDRFKRQIDFKLTRSSKKKNAVRNKARGHNNATSPTSPTSARDLNKLRKSRRAARKR